MSGPRFLIKWVVCQSCGELIGEAYDTQSDSPGPVTPWMHDTWEHEGACKTPLPAPAPLTEMLDKYLTMRGLVQ